MARRSAASPLAVFLDYILTTSIAEGKAALEASIAAFGARQRVVSADVPQKRVRPAVTTAAAPAAAETRPGPVAVPTPAATTVAAPRRRGRPVGSKKSVVGGNGAAAAPRRRRPAIDTAPATTTAAVEDLPPTPLVPLPDQTVDETGEA